MKEIRVLVTQRVFEGEACRVTVERIDGCVQVVVEAKDEGVPIGYTPELFAAVSRDLSSVNERVQEAAREFLREPYITGRFAK